MEAPTEPEDSGENERRTQRRKVFLVYVLILGGGVIVSFLGGLILRNPALPSYVISAIVNGFQGHAPNPRPVLPSPAATLYLQYTEIPLTAFSQEQIATANKILDLASKRMWELDQAEDTAEGKINQQIMQPLQSARSPQEFGNIKSAGTELIAAARDRFEFYKNLTNTIGSDLRSAGISDALAQQVGASFSKKMSAEYQLPRSSAAKDFGDAIVAWMDFLVRNPKWTRQPDGRFTIPDTAALQQFGTLQDIAHQAYDKLKKEKGY